MSESVGPSHEAVDVLSCTLLERLSVRDFRNLRPTTLALPPEGIALVGENGQGKTNVLEAVRYLQMLRSFRGAHDQELVSFGASGFHLAARLSGARAESVAAGFERQGKRKKLVVDGVETPRLADALGVFPAVIFAPQDATLVSGGPGMRRRFLDIMLSLTSRSYLASLQRYRTALAQRNAAMRDDATTGAALEQRVAVWEPALAGHGAVLWRARQSWVDEYAPRYAELCAAVGESGSCRLLYRRSSDSDSSDPEGMLRETLARKRQLDMRHGLTHAGPHRDDLVLSLDGHELRCYGSAGQQRTAAIVLRLLEGATFRAATGSEPIVLLDDPFAELDARRTTRILELLCVDGRGQIILAVPRANDIPAGLTRLERRRIVAGGISELS